MAQPNEIEPGLLEQSDVAVLHVVGGGVAKPRKRHVPVRAVEHDPFAVEEEAVIGDGQPAKAERFRV